MSNDPLSLPLQIDKAGAIRWLGVLLEWYAAEEERYYKKLWGTEEERDPGAFCEGTEREWMRYRQEAAALRAGIAAIEAQS
jgi:hypothetical protein